MPPKTRKSAQISWYKCANCNAHLIPKDVDVHKQNNCPPNLAKPGHSFLLDGVLYGTLDAKTNEDIKGMSSNEKNNLVFLSQDVIQLCSLTIGEYAKVTVEGCEDAPYARIVWPTVEKMLTSVLFTQNGMDLLEVTPNANVTVSKITPPIYEAHEIVVTLQNAPKPLEISTELCTRLQKQNKNRLYATGNNVTLMYYGKLLRFRIKSVSPSDRIRTNLDVQPTNLSERFSELCLEKSEENVGSFCSVSEKTRFRIFESDDAYRIEKDAKTGGVKNEIGGADFEIEELTQIMQIALGKVARVQGIKPTRAVLIHGTSGTGKSMILDYVGLVSKASVFKITASEVYADQTPEAFFKRRLEEALDKTPSVVLLEELDVLCPSRTSARVTDSEKRTSGVLVNFLDELQAFPKRKVFLMATTNKLEGIDGNFRRCGRFDREIEIPVPGPLGRLRILQKLLAQASHALTETELKEIADAAHGYVGSDLVFLCSRAALRAAQSQRYELNPSDFKHALTRVVPSAMRQVRIEVPSVKWTDIGGQRELKLALKQAVEWPLKHPQSFVRMGITPPRGVLMFGPPGCSKTMIAKALATESGLNFISIKGPELFSKWVGESERAVREVFGKARQVAPSIIFFDEIDALGGERSSGSASGASVQERVLAQLLTELDGVTPLGDVTVLAATNRPDRIDKALLRPGRLDRIVYVPLPDRETRREIFELKLARMPIGEDVDVEELVDATEGYSGAEVNAICHEAAMKALEEDLDARVVNMEHFRTVIGVIKPRTSDSLLAIYEEYVKVKV